ncbi:MAG: xanthine dehydrogenase small subunit [Woeseia sp.]
MEAEPLADMSNHRTDKVRFVLDGTVVELRNVDPTRTVLQYLREDLHRTGSKEGCAEGDCGACTVVLAEAGKDNRLHARAINACIQFLPTLDGKELLTVESLRGSDGGLHPVQQAMVDCHGSQCGFCTPGFVMSLFALYKNVQSPKRVAIDNALAGNLCRCTGYRPIVDAARKMYERAPERNDDWLVAACNAGPASADEKRRVALLQSLQHGDTVTLEYGSKRYFAPRSSAELAALLQDWPGAQLLAGGTDVGLWVTKQYRELNTVIYTGRVAELCGQGVAEEAINIGAAVTLTDAMPLLLHYLPTLNELLLRFASPPIRNAGTLGGNVANGSPIGDSMPVLLVADACLRLRSARGTRDLPLAEFYLDYQKNALQTGEFVEQIVIPLPTASDELRTYKISKRFDQDISAVCGAYRLRFDDEGRIEEARVAYGGLAATPRRASCCEAVLQGALPSADLIHKAQLALLEDFEPISDMRASDQYRRQVAGNLLQRLFMDISAAQDGADFTGIYEYGRAHEA